jgi:hypothetical protein
MSMREFWCIYDAKVGEPRYGRMTESQVSRLYDALTAAEKAEAAAKEE